MTEMVTTEGCDGGRKITKGDIQEHLMKAIKGGLCEECLSRHGKDEQEKGGLPCTKEDLRVQVNSADVAAFLIHGNSTLGACWSKWI